MNRGSPFHAFAVQLLSLTILMACDTGSPTGPEGDETTPLDGRGGGIIAFSSDRGGNSDIYVMNADGRNQRQLTQRNGFWPNWSPDGTEVVFESLRSGTAAVYSIRISNGEVRPLTDGTVESTHPDLSPDGEYLAFTQNIGGNQDIVVMRLDGGEISPLTVQAGPDWGPSWSPDGSNQRLLVSAIQRDEFPSWSPNGQEMVFESDIEGPEHIYKVGIGGTGLIRLTGSEGGGGGPSWRPIR